MYYNARYYPPAAPCGLAFGQTIPALGRFVSADTIVPEPGNPQSLNRYAYVTNNPLKYIDPSGHALWPGEVGGSRKGRSVPPWDNALGQHVEPGSRAALYIVAHNHGLAPWQDHPSGNIDDRFDPFHGYPNSVILYKMQAEKDLYAGDVSKKVTEACKTDSCRNPLNDQEPQSAFAAPALSVLIDNATNTPMLLFWIKVTGDSRIYEDETWNFELLWTSEVMGMREQALLEAQWEYLKYYEDYYRMMGDPGVDLDFAETSYHPADQ